MKARPPRAQVTRLIRKVFGLSALRPGQQAVIDSVLDGRHTLAVMPTGAGKSLCDQVPAMLKRATMPAIGGGKLRAEAVAQGAA